MIEIPSKTQKWLVLGAPLICREPFDIDIELLSGKTMKFYVKKGDEAKVIEFVDNFVRVGFFDFFGDRQKNGYIQHLRLDLIYHWEPQCEVFQQGKVERAKVPMILDQHPDCSGKQTEERYIGYWASHEDPAICHYAQEGKLLPWPGDFVDTSWDAEERAIVIDYLNKAPNVEFWRGFSYCRLCSQKVGLGSTDKSYGSCRPSSTYDTFKSDKTYVWPAGFSHYLEVHGVKPPVEFIQHVLQSPAFSKEERLLGWANMFDNR